MSPDNKGWLDVAVGDWLMLAGRLPSPVMNVYCWYRVANAGTTMVSGSNYVRYVTLEGPDWIPQIPLTRAVLMTGVVGVYSMPLERELSALWDRR